MINDSDSPRDRLDLDRVIAIAEAENQADDTPQPTYADRVEIGYKAFEIGLWELGRDNHAGARPWLRSAVDFGVEDARPLLALCLTSPLTESAPVPPRTHGSNDTVPAGGDAVPDVRSEGAALAVFALEFGRRSARERQAAFAWFPRRQLAIVRSTARLTILTRALTRTLDHALRIDLDRIHARVTDDRVLAEDRAKELASTLEHAHNQALDLKRALDRDRDHAGDHAFARGHADGLVRDIGRIHKLARDHDIARVSTFDQIIAHVLGPYHHEALVHDFAKVRDNALIRARDRALDRAVPTDRVRDLALTLAHNRALEPACPVHGAAGTRHSDIDQAVAGSVDGNVAIALDLAAALDSDRVNALNPDRDHDRFDRELITAVTGLEEALTPAAQ